LDGRLIPVDFAMNARAYGCETYSVRTESELIEALEAVKKSSVSTLIDIKVLPKTMTEGYASWWRVGNAEVSKKEEIINKSKEQKEELKKARAY
jgi:3D-(3,5/4)-trihydroxycyclohexane-1,2-dione acylhydrolase (decyclizing)